MKHGLFDTQEKIDTAIANLKTLETHPGWLLIIEVVQANIEELERQILDGIEGITEVGMNTKREKLKAYKEVIQTPKYLVNRFEKGEDFEEDTDPYHTIASLRETRQES